MIKPRELVPKSEEAIKRGIDFIYRTANNSDGFASYGGLMICCFALVGATSRDAGLRQLAKSRAHKLSQRWKRLHPVLPHDASADLVLDFTMLRYALSRIGQRDVVNSEEIRAAVERFSVQDLLGFNPATEPPPNDLPFACDCGLKNQRGRKFCRQCKRRLQYQSRYRVWMEALANTYVSERYGLRLGTRYLDVLKWLPSMRPYPESTEEDIELLRDAIYAVTHVVYVLNDYGTYRLSPRLLPQEVAFLKANVASACEREDPEILGELLDSLRAFGLSGSHQLIRHGTRYLLTSQNKDGSWGDPDDENIRTRCHTTWTAIDGLRSYAWRGERSAFSRLRPLLK